MALFKRVYRLARVAWHAPWRRRRALAQALVAVPLAWAALRLVPFQRVVQASAPQPRRMADDREFGRLVWAGAVVSHALFPARPCLPQSLATRYLLARAGCPTALRIGVQRRGAGLAAHAWLERDGVPITDPDGATSFAPLQAPSAL
jgi:hypothetical protein